MPMHRVPDPPEHNPDGLPCPCGGPDCADERPYIENPGDAMPCGCVDYHMADCDGSAAMTKDDYLDLYAGSYPEDWPDDEGSY